ncbi:MAG: hypothetical protein KA408_15615 [Flavobacteriales bacterium]|nr:hypothetical protein [Flavobacteriales bacterium]
MFKKSGIGVNEDHLLEWCLFLLVFSISLLSGWAIFSANPFEFLRHGGDQLGYYHWLPSVFIDQSVDHMYWCFNMENGKRLSIFTLGVAVLQLPFFFLGQIGAEAFVYPIDGFSSPYGVAQLIGIATYAGAGIVLAYRIAKRFSTKESALIAAVTLFAATNLFYYSVYEPNMSHVYSFFLAGLFCYCSLRLLDGADHPSRWVHVFLVVLGGSLLVLIRHLNIVTFIFPLVIVLNRPNGFTTLWRNLITHRVALIAGVVLAIIPWVLQSWYWHYITGDWITFTYGMKDEHFDFTTMEPWAVLTSVRNGWLIYTPLMIPVVITLLVHAWRRSAVAIGIVLVLLFTWLLYSAWWCWWLGTSFGGRGFVDLYALFAIPLAWLFRSIFARSISTRVVTGFVLTFLIVLNFGLMERFNWEWSKEEWTWQLFFKEVSGVMGGR